ncbi:hypothetical protein GGR55DRAFT_657759 [Xylaria sp. FL0064]|nr:hypothetical protein GGR55DRAFT_657759 [Xylaria sp. FL0064]
MRSTRLIIVISLYQAHISAAALLLYPIRMEFSGLPETVRLRFRPLQAGCLLVVSFEKPKTQRLQSVILRPIHSQH